MAPANNDLIRLLIEIGFLTPSEAEAARAQAASTGGSVLSTLITSGVLTPSHIERARTADSSAEFIPLSDRQR